MAQKRSTRQKQYLQGKLEEIDAFFSAEDLLETAKKDGEKISTATVYRFLKELKNAKAIYSYRCGGRTAYSKQNKGHCLFICENTGKTTHFNIDSLDFLKGRIPGSITSFQLEVRGQCNKCLACLSKKRNKKK